MLLVGHPAPAASYPSPSLVFTSGKLAICKFYGNPAGTGYTPNSPVRDCEIRSRRGSRQESNLGSSTGDLRSTSAPRRRYGTPIRRSWVLGRRGGATTKARRAQGEARAASSSAARVGPLASHAGTSWATASGWNARADTASSEIRAAEYGGTQFGATADVFVAWSGPATCLVLSTSSFPSRTLFASSPSLMRSCPPACSAVSTRARQERATPPSNGRSQSSVGPCFAPSL